MPKVSVVMNCFNGERYLREAIDSVVNQTYGNWEIVFWDNASTDGSARIAQSYPDCLRYFRGDRTVTLGQARNYALAHADGEYIAFFDCDDTWHRDKLEKQVRIFTEHPDLGFVFSDTNYMKSEGTITGSILASKRSAARLRLPDMLYDYKVAWSSVMISRRALRQTGDVDSSLVFCEDYDMLLRLAIGFPVYYIPEQLCNWRMHAASGTTRTGFSVKKAEKIYILKKILADVRLTPADRAKVRNFLFKIYVTTGFTARVEHKIRSLLSGIFR